MTPDLNFGPAGEQWHYSRATKTYDLTRGTKGGFTLATSQGVADTYLTVAPSLSALVVVDMQNFFLHPSCRDHPPGLAAVEPTIKVVEKCRELGIQARQSFLSPRPYPRFPLEPSSAGPLTYTHEEPIGGQESKGN